MKTQNTNIKKQVIKGIIIMLGLMAVTFNFSCNKYLDVKQNSSQSLISSAADCQAVLDNYQAMNTHFPSDGEAQADNYYLSDTNYNTLSPEDAQFYTWAKSAQRSSSTLQWVNTYQTVYYANTILQALTTIGLGGADQATINGIKGSALFFRAFSFYQIAQLYCKPYTTATAGQDPGIPIRLTGDINAKSVRGTVQQTYDQIVGDMKTAVSLLPNTSIIASRPNKASAYAFLARIYLSMGDYADAGSAANSSLELNSGLIDYNTVSTTTAIPFAPRFNKEVLFQSIMTNVLYIISGANYQPYGNTLNPSIARVDSNLYATYDANDLRKQIFFKAGSDSGYKFTGDYEPTTTATFFDGLATDEVYLIRAECYARAGNAIAAITDLNTLLKTRWVTGTYVNMTATNADDALSKILTERRKELIFRGLRWSDLRRLNMDSRFQVTLTHVVNGQTYTLPPNDLRYVQLFPVDVIANSTMAQNSR